MRSIVETKHAPNLGGKHYLFVKYFLICALKAFIVLIFVIYLDISFTLIQINDWAGTEPCVIPVVMLQYLEFRELI